MPRKRKRGVPKSKSRNKDMRLFLYLATPLCPPLPCALPSPSPLAGWLAGCGQPMRCPSLPPALDDLPCLATSATVDQLSQLGLNSPIHINDIDNHTPNHIYPTRPAARNHDHKRSSPAPSISQTQPLPFGANSETRPSPSQHSSRSPSISARGLAHFAHYGPISTFYSRVGGGTRTSREALDTTPAAAVDDLLFGPHRRTASSQAIAPHLAICPVPSNSNAP